MAERPGSPPRGAEARNLRSSYERELLELQNVHTAHADDLDDAFSDTVSHLLSRLSSDEIVFKYPISPELSSDASSRSSDNAQAPGVETPVSSDDSTHRETIRSLFEFIYTEFMPAPQEERMGTFHRFLERVRENVSTAPLQHCVTAVRAMKRVIISKFEYLRSFKKKPNEDEEDDEDDDLKLGADCSNFLGARQTGFVSNPGASRDTHQNVPERKEPKRLRSDPAGVITPNPTYVAGNIELPREELRTPRSVVRTIQVNPSHSRSHGVPEVDRRERSPFSREGSPFSREGSPSSREGSPSSGRRRVSRQNAFDKGYLG